MEINHKIFEEEIRHTLEQKWKVKFFEKKIEGLNKTFDFVSDNYKYIGDSKYFNNSKSNNSKLSIITEYVWLLEKTLAERKFLVFGNNKDVVTNWLKKYGLITNVEFYFYDMKNIELLNKNVFEERKNILNKKKNTLLDLSVWSDKDFDYLKDLRRDMNKWKTKY